MVLNIRLAVSIVVTFMPGAALGQADCERRAQRPPPVAGQADQETRLRPLLACNQPIDDRAACNRFVGKALEILHSNLDFRRGPGDYYLANDIANGLSQPGNVGWKLIGAATSQSSLDAAQARANEGRPVVAAKPASPGPGHVAVVLRGTTESYVGGNPRWGMLRGPNTASAFLDSPNRVFIGCPLSDVWQRPDGVMLYYKP